MALSIQRKNSFHQLPHQQRYTCRGRLLSTRLIVGALVSIYVVQPVREQETEDPINCTLTNTELRMQKKPHGEIRGVEKH